MSKRLYIARWPDGSAWIVQASSLEEVADILDEEGDPFGAEVEPYNGALAIEIRPDKDVGEVEIRSCRGETGNDTVDDILKKAFPKLNEVLENYEDLDGKDAHEAWLAALKQEGSVEAYLTELVMPRAHEKWLEAVRSWHDEFTNREVKQCPAIHRMDTPADTTASLSSGELAALVELVQARGEARAAADLGVDRSVVLRLLAGRPTRRASIVLARVRLAELHHPGEP